MPDESVAEGLAASLAASLRPGERVLLPQADIARPVLAQRLAAAGAKVVAVPAYRTVIGSGGVDLPALLADKQVDAITLTSASTARNLLQRLAAAGADGAGLEGVCIACIGPVTAETAQTHWLVGGRHRPAAKPGGPGGRIGNLLREDDMNTVPAAFPALRARRLRLNANLRRMVRETTLEPADFIAPLFVRYGHGLRQPIRSMPGQFQLSVDQLAGEARELASLGIPAVILFGIPATKDAVGSDNYCADGIVPQAIRAIKDAAPDLLVISDMCFCEYTDHGHCGVINTPGQAHLSRPPARGLPAQRPDPRSARAGLGRARRSWRRHHCAVGHDGRHGGGYPWRRSTAQDFTM